MNTETLDDEVIALCEQRGLDLRPGLAVLAIFAGRTDEATRILGQLATAAKDAAVASVVVGAGVAVVKAQQDTASGRIVSWKPMPKKKPGRKSPLEGGAAERRGVSSAPGLNMKICTHCGEYKGFRAFPKGGDTCTACETGEKPPKFKRATTLAEAETFDD